MNDVINHCSTPSPPAAAAAAAAVAGIHSRRHHSDAQLQTYGSAGDVHGSSRDVQLLFIVFDSNSFVPWLLTRLESNATVAACTSNRLNNIGVVARSFYQSAGLRTPRSANRAYIEPQTSEKLLSVFGTFIRMKNKQPVKG